MSVCARRAGGVWGLGSGAILVYEAGRARTVAPSGTIPGDGMLGMVETDDGSLWVGGPALHRFRDGRWQRFTNSGGEFTVLMPDGRSRLLVAQTTGDGTSALSWFQDGRFAPAARDVPLVHVQRLVRDHAGLLWVDEPRAADPPRRWSFLRISSLSPPAGSFAGALPGVLRCGPWRRALSRPH